MHLASVMVISRGATAMGSHLQLLSVIYLIRRGVYRFCFLGGSEEATAIHTHHTTPS